MGSQSSLAIQQADTTTGPAQAGAMRGVPVPLQVVRNGRPSRSRQGEAALAAVKWGILDRVGRYGWLRIETIPATWPMTRHLVRRMAEQLVAEGLLERLPDGAVRLTPAGTMARAAEGRRRGE